jgi:hypothetical protein
MFSFIQVLGHIGYKSPPVNPAHFAQVNLYTLLCNEAIPSDDENVTMKHHLYLHARIELGGAYVPCVKIGFSLNTIDPENFWCSDCKEECPVHARQKLVEGGYYADDLFMRLLSLKRWIYNVYPPEAHFKTNLTGNQVVWNVPSIPDDQYLSSALVTPLSHCHQRRISIPIKMPPAFPGKPNASFKFT